MRERVIIDFETTGLSAMMGDRATEVAAVVIDETGIIDRFQSLMNGGRRIPPCVQQLTGISNAMISRAPKTEVVMRELLDFVAGRPLVAHNAAFDHGFLGAELDRIGAACSSVWLCSLKVARRVYPEAPNHRLQTLIRHLCIETVGQYHRALADAEMTALLWLRMEQKLQHDFALPEVPLELMRRIQAAPCKGLGQCVGSFKRSVSSA
jgi:DNA polymerase-3 subunit epsilon